MFSQHKLFTLLLIIGLLFIQFARSAPIAQAQAQQPTHQTNQAPPGYKLMSAVTPHRVNHTTAYDCTVQTDIPSTECQALVALYNQTNGPSWTNNAGWLQDYHPCAWQGITCDTGYVINISLAFNQLNGSIPSDLGNFANLQYLYLDRNQLSGSIPSEMGNLANLLWLDLSSNQLSGSIPSELGSLKKLQFLDLGINQLSGSIPPEMGSLANLQNLALDSNQLSGSIPSMLGNLASLQGLVLSTNQLSGSIPSTLGNLVNLQGLYLDNNQLSGSIPPTLDKLDKLFDFNLGYNLLSTTDPALIVFLTDKDPDWAQTQTVPPSGLHVQPASFTSIVLSWNPILYTGDGGYYEISQADAIGGPFTVIGQTASKSSIEYTVHGLLSGGTYYFRLRTFTPSHGYQQNDLWSDYSETIPEIYSFFLPMIIR